MGTRKSRVTSKGQIVIPKPLREKYAMMPTMMVRWIPREDGLLMVPETEDVIKAARGMLKGSGLLKAYLREKQREKLKEGRGVAQKK